MITKQSNIKYGTFKFMFKNRERWAVCNNVWQEIIPHKNGALTKTEYLFQLQLTTTQKKITNN